MHARLSQYLNEIISLLLMALMIVALVTAQVDAAGRLADATNGAIAASETTNVSFRSKGE